MCHATAAVVGDDVARRGVAESRSERGARNVDRVERAVSPKKAMGDAAGDVAPHDISLCIDPRGGHEGGAWDIKRCERARCRWCTPMVHFDVCLCSRTCTEERR